MVTDNPCNTTISLGQFKTVQLLNICGLSQWSQTTPVTRPSASVNSKHFNYLTFVEYHNGQGSKVAYSLQNHSALYDTFENWTSLDYFWRTRLIKQHTHLSMRVHPQNAQIHLFASLCCF